MNGRHQSVEAQLCIQRDAGTGSSLNPAVRPARVNAALDLGMELVESSWIQLSEVWRAAFAPILSCRMVVFEVISVLRFGRVFE